MSGPNFANRTLWTADNLDILRGMNSESVDLIYLDPPFNSNRTYEAPIGSQAAGAAFKDTWTLSDVDLAWHGEVSEQSPALYEVIKASRLAAGDAMMSYLIMMAVRLVQLRRILKSSGSIYLHCDPTASHYLKMLMDVIFGRRFYRNEIAWCYRGLPSKARVWQRKHDVILFYTKTDSYIFEVLRGAPTAGSLRTFESGQRRGYNVNLSKRMATVFDRDKYEKAVRLGTIPSDLKPVPFKGGRPPLRDWWEDIRMLGGPKNKERVGYPTQKPLALVERIIRASSPTDGMVLDPFCGCATAMVAAERASRRWVGIDISPLAVKLVKQRLADEMNLFYDVTARTDIPKRTDLGVLPPYKTHKHTLYGKQEGDCNGCKVHFPYKNLTVDHVVPQSKGGTDHYDNLQLLCGWCNSVKGNGTWEEFKVKMAANGYL